MTPLGAAITLDPLLSLEALKCFVNFIAKIKTFQPTALGAKIHEKAGKYLSKSNSKDPNLIPVLRVVLQLVIDQVSVVNYYNEQGLVSDLSNVIFFHESNLSAIGTNDK